MDRPTCGTCPYWLSYDDTKKHAEERTGECRRHPRVLCETLTMLSSLYMTGQEGGVYEGPFRSHDEAVSLWEKSMESVDDKTSWAYPIHTAEDWCGEHPDFPQWIESQRKEKTECT